jgi:hypothetical protein
MLLEAETNKYCPGGYDIGAISNLITWVLNFFLSAAKPSYAPDFIVSFEFCCRIFGQWLTIRKSHIPLPYLSLIYISTYI